MVTQTYQKDSVKFICKGISTSIAQDIIPEGFFSYLENTRVITEGSIRARPKVDIIGNLNPVVGDLVHSIKKLIDKSSSLQTYIVGAGTKLYSGSLSIPNLIESGFSGEPLSIIEFRPEEAIAAYLYVADKLKFRRVGVDNISNPVGIDPPLSAVTIEVDKPQRKVIDECGAGTLASWVNGGSAGAPTNVNRVNTTITAIVLDGALPNFCSIIPASFQPAIQVGAQLRLGGTEDIFVEGVYKGLINSGVCTIASIKYESGVNGKCIIDLSVPITGLEVGSILYINSSEYVRVLDVITGVNGSVSVKVSSVGTFAVGNTVLGVASFRTYITLNHIAAEAIATDAIKTTIGASGLSTLTRVANFDFTNTANRGLGDNDFFHISLLSSDASQIEEIQIQADFDISTNDYLHNWFSYAVRVNDLLSAVELAAPTLTVQQQVINRQEVYNRYLSTKYMDYRADIDYPYIEPYNPYDGGYVENNPTQPITSDGQMNLGDSQWTEILVPFRDFQRNGSDISRGWKDIKSIQVSIKTKGAVDVYIDSIWVGGGYELDSVDNKGNVVPYRYMARYRESKTKVVSNWSPINREGVASFRNRHLLSIPNSSDSRVDRKDYARIGGANSEFRILGTSLNDGSKFTDDISDFSLRDNPLALRITNADNIGDRDYFRPFAILDLPKKGTCNIQGNILTVVSGDQLKTDYALGTRILINNVLNTFYTQPTSVTQVELEDNVGTLTGVPFEIKEPLRTGQPLPIVFGVFGLGNSGLVLFGAGDINAAGTLYWLDPNSPDTQSDTNRLEITPPSEPIIGGCMYDGYPFIWTNKRSYMIVPSVNENGILTFTARENANSTGLASKNTLCVAEDAIYYLRRDLTGIDKVQGNGNPVSITDAVLANLFVQNGKLPTNYTPNNFITVYPPDFVNHLDKQRLRYANGLLFYRYVNILGNAECLVYDIKGQRWISRDTYINNNIDAIVEDNNEGDYRILLGLAGQIGSYLDTGTYENAVKASIITAQRNQGSIRIQKDYREAVVDLIRGIVGAATTTRFGYNNNTLYETPPDIIGDGNLGRGLIIRDIDENAKNISSYLIMDLGKDIEIFGIEYSFVPRPEYIFLRPTDFFYGEGLGDKYFTTVIIKTTTSGPKNIKIETDDGVLSSIITINHNTEQVIAYPFGPLVAHGVRIIPQDNVQWTEPEVTWIYEPYPEYVSSESFWTNGGNESNKYITGFVLVADTNNLVAEFEVKGDDNILLETFNSKQHNGKSTHSYSFTNPVLAHEVKLIPLNGNKIRVFGILLIAESYPEKLSAHTFINALNNLEDKYIRAVNLELDTFGVDTNIDIYADGVLVDTLNVNHNGRLSKTYTFQTPFIARNIQLNPSQDVILFNQEWITDDYNTLSDTITEWMNGGYEGYKFIQGFRLTADTNNLEAEFKVQGDNEIDLETFISRKHNGKSTFAYSFSEPKFSNLLRIIPIDNIRIFNIEWIIDKEPSPAKVWEGQPNNYSTPNIKQAKLLHITHRSTTDLVISLSYDNKPDDIYNISHSDNKRKEDVIFLRPNKWKQLRPRIESSEDFQLYRNGCKLFITDLTQPNDYIIANPFGDDSNVTDVRI